MTPQKSRRPPRVILDLPKWIISALLAGLVMSGCNMFTPPLYKASAAGDINSVQKLLSEGADPNTRNSDKDARPALVEAANNGHAEIVSLLLKYGADVNAAGKRSGWNALMRAACSDRLSHRDRVTAGKARLQVVTLLLEAGADVNTRDQSGGMTPLMFACIAEPANAEVIKLLVNYGADVNARNKFGETALMDAVSTGDYRLVQLLIQLGAKK